MIVRVEEDDEGNLYIKLPEDLIEEFNLDIGHAITWSLQEDDIVLLEF